LTIGKYVVGYTYDQLVHLLRAKNDDLSKNKNMKRMSTKQFLRSLKNSQSKLSQKYKYRQH
jgi:hypothetical protein